MRSFFVLALLSLAPSPSFAADTGDEAAPLPPPQSNFAAPSASAAAKPAARGSVKSGAKPAMKPRADGAIPGGNGAIPGGNGAIPGGNGAMPGANGGAIPGANGGAIPGANAVPNGATPGGGIPLGSGGAIPGAPGPGTQFGPMEEGGHTTRFHFAIGPAWMHVLRDNYAPAFANNGFATPGRDRVAFDLLGAWTTETNWQIGLGLTELSVTQDSGTNSAEYKNAVLGLWLAREVYSRGTFDVTAGSLVGFNDADLTVFSAARNGRLRETSAVIGPSVGVASRVSPSIKLGARLAYFLPFGESTSASGSDLGVSRIGTRGFLLALQVIFGR